MKTAIVTGGTRGLGLAISRKLAAQGFNLVLGYNTNHSAAQAAREELEQQVTVVTIAGDVKQPATADALFKPIEDQFKGQLTALVHLAGYAINAMLPGKFTFEQYEEAQELYPKAFLRFMERALKYMADGQGRVVVVSSHGVHNPGKAYAMLGPAKGALEVLAKHYALAIAPRGITVNIVAPGYIRTEEWEHYRAAIPYLDQLPPTVTPMGRWGQPEDVAPVVAFLCSEESRFVTGQHIFIDGGTGLSLFWNINQLTQKLFSN
jgi:NAD(P)-dependent dehydrogenase (short-subunit alcohol dehydrogenase family)